MIATYENGLTFQSLFDFWVTSPPNSTPKWLPSYLFLTLLLCILFIVYLPRCTLPDFLSVSSQASLPLLSCCHRTTTATSTRVAKSSKKKAKIFGKFFRRYSVFVDFFCWIFLQTRKIAEYTRWPKNRDQTSDQKTENNLSNSIALETFLKLYCEIIKRLCINSSLQWCSIFQFIYIYDVYIIYK